MSLYSGLPLLTLQDALAQAQAALPLLERGESVHRIATGDQQIMFVPTTPEALRRSIRDLQNAIAVSIGQPPRGLLSVATWTRSGGSRWDA